MEKKLRYSHQREMIYKYLLGTNEHPSAEMIYEDLKKEIEGLSLGTVYRNLKLLESLGSIRRVASHQGTERYDAICGDHAHFICKQCGMVHDIENLNVNVIRDGVPLDEGFSFLQLDLNITGLCPECSKSV